MDNSEIKTGGMWSVESTQFIANDPISLYGKLIANIVIPNGEKQMWVTILTCNGTPTDWYKVPGPQEAGESLAEHFQNQKKVEE